VSSHAAIATLSLTLGLLACSNPQPQPSSAPQPAAVAVPAAAAAPVAEAGEPDPATLARIEDLELELAQLKLTIEQMQAAGVGTVQAEDVAYQPNATTMAARTAQDALDELWTLNERLRTAATDMGEPGDGLFDLENGPLGPRDRDKQHQHHEPQHHEPQHHEGPPIHGG